MKALVPSLLMLAVGASALDTPLVLRPQGTGNSSITAALVVNPSNGVITYYDADAQKLSLEGSASFAFDLELKDKSVYTEQKGDPFSWLRLGDPDWKMNPQTLMGQLPKKKPAADKPSMLEAAQTAETNFWGKEHEYDGVVRAAWSGNIAALCLPSKHAILFYDTTTPAQGIKLLHWCNYGPLLLLPTGYNTTPTPQEVFSKLPVLQQKQLEDEAKKAEEEGADQPKETPKSDVWVAVGQNETFVVVDIANNRIMSFQIAGKQATVLAVRNISYELKLPPRQNYNSAPDEQATLQAYQQSHKKDIAGASLDWVFADQKMMTYNLRALVAASAAKSKGGAPSSSFQACSLDDKIVLNFTDQHKLMTYNISGSSLELISVRDYTIDLAIAALDEQIKDKIGARELVGMAEKSSKTHGSSMRTLKFALRLDPLEVDAIEKDTRLTSELAKEADWGPMMDQAHKDKDALIAKLQGIKDAALKMKEEDDKLLKPPEKEPKDPKDKGK